MHKAKTPKELALKELQTIPGVGRSISLDLWNISIKSMAELKGQNPAELYDQLNTFSGVILDPCMLYTMRCAVYFVTEKHHEKEKLNWWYWKGKTYNE